MEKQRSKDGVGVFGEVMYDGAAKANLCLRQHSAGVFAGFRSAVAQKQAPLGSQKRDVHSSGMLAACEEHTPQ